MPLPNWVFFQLPTSIIQKSHFAFYRKAFVLSSFHLLCLAERSIYHTNFFPETFANIVSLRRVASSLGTGWLSTSSTTFCCHPSRKLRLSHWRAEHFTNASPCAKSTFSLHSLTGIQHSRERMRQDRKSVLHKSIFSPFLAAADGAGSRHAPSGAPGAAVGSSAV